MTVSREAFITGLPKSARKAATAIDAALEDCAAVPWSFDEVAERCRISRASVRYVLRALQLVGLIEIGAGAYRVSLISRSERWQTLSPDDVAERLERARLPKQGRPFKKKPATAKKVVKIEQPEPEPDIEPQRQVPSLPVLRFMQGWEG